MEGKLEEIREMLKDVSSIPNENNSLMISASDYIADVEYLIFQINAREEEIQQLETELMMLR